MNYKAPDNSLHVIEPEFAYLLPTGCVEITEAEADAIRTANTPQPDPIAQVKAQIDQIERETLMNRAAREWMIESTIREAMREFNVDRATAEAGLYAGNVAFKRIKDIDNQIAALRAQIGAA